MIPAWVFDYGWYAWLAYFLVLEGFALFRSKPGATLSEHVWHWFGYDPTGLKNKSALARVRRLALLAFMAWLTVHFIGGGQLM